MTPERAQAKALDFVHQIVTAIIETVNESDPTIGAPGGHLYAALMHAGINLDQFEKIMSTLVQSGRVRKRGHCYFPANH